MDNLLEMQNIEPKKDIDRYLLQINRIKLQDYIQCGLIAPDKYLGDEIENDVQSKNPNLLLVSDGFVENLSEHQILVELILTDDEKTKLTLCGEVYYFDFLLPVTRIKKIYVQNKNIIKHILVNLETSEKGYLPQEIFDVYTKQKKIQFDKRSYTPNQNDVQIFDFSNNITKFDKRMGMFSFMKNTELYYSDETKSISNYSNHYFFMLSYFLQESLEKNNFEQLSLIKQNEAFEGLLNLDKQIDKEFLTQILDTIENQDIKEVFANILRPNNTRNTLVALLEKEEELYYLIGLIFYFRQKDSNKKDNFKIDMKSLIPYKVAEISLAVLGIYLGYKNLRAEETIDINNKVFQEILGETFNIKFKMDSKLDYITIESIYNYCFDVNKKKGYDFEYLAYPKNSVQILKKSQTKVKTKEFQRYYEVDASKIYFNVPHIKIKHNSFEEIISKKLEKYPDEKLILGKHHIFSFIAKYLPSKLKVANYNEKFQLYSEKSDVIEDLKAEESKKKQDELFLLLEVDGK